jgi:hypothetical protein
MQAVLIAWPTERNNPDTHRIDGEEWRGPSVHCSCAVIFSVWRGMREKAVYGRVARPLAAPQKDHKFLSVLGNL